MIAYDNSFLNMRSIDDWKTSISGSNIIWQSNEPHPQDIVLIGPLFFMLKIINIFILKVMVFAESFLTKIYISTSKSLEYMKYSNHLFFSRKNFGM